MVGVWIAPVTAQVMMTLLDVAMAGFYLGSNLCTCSWLEPAPVVPLQTHFEWFAGGANDCS
jgi:hypothetical protein